MYYFLQTLGCQMNYSDSERIATTLAKLGYQPTYILNEADLIIFNTCSVRQKAEDRVFGQMKQIEKLKKENSDVKVGLTGCMVKETGLCSVLGKNELCQRISVLDFQFRIEDLEKLPDVLRKIDKKRNNINIIYDNINPSESYFRIKPNYTSQYQAFIPIMTGCDNFCSYCIVPYARGREKSRELQNIVAEVQNFAKKGGIEITLLGQNVNSYAPIDYDYKNESLPPFVKLLTEINKIKEIKRIRFTSSHPKDMSNELIRSLAQLENICNHLHLPVQAGDNDVLHNMNRNYTVEDYKFLINKICRAVPNIAISTDVIVGFPGETEKQFLNTVQLFEEINFDMAYIAQFSPRKGTIAGDQLEDNVPQNEKSRRFHYLNQVLKKSSLEKNCSYFGQTVDVLVEKLYDDFAEGKTTSFKTIQFPNKKNEDLIGQIIPVTITETNTWSLRGKKI